MKFCSQIVLVLVDKDDVMDNNDLDEEKEDSKATILVKVFCPPSACSIQSFTLGT